MYFNGAKVKSITDAGTGEQVLDDEDEDEVINLEGIKSIQEVENMEELRSMLEVNNIKEIENIQEIENIEEIDDGVAEKFIRSENLQNQINRESADAEEETGSSEGDNLQEQANTEEELIDLLDSGIDTEKEKVHVLEQIKENHQHKYEELIDQIEAALNQKVENAQVTF